MERRATPRSTGAAFSPPPRDSRRRPRWRLKPSRAISVPAPSRQRYPDPDIVVIDKRFKYKLGNTPIQRLHTGTLWAEGPAWSGVGRYLLWSDIPNDEHLRYLEEDDHVSRRFRYPAGNSNGNTFDYEGRQIACQHGTRKVVRYEHNGKTTVLAEKFDGAGVQRAERRGGASERRLDLVHRSGLRLADGIRGQPAAAERATPRRCARRRSTASTRAATIAKVADEPFKPNGLCFSHDYNKLYVADTGVSHYPEAKSQIWVYDVDGADAEEPEAFASMEMERQDRLCRRHPLRRGRQCVVERRLGRRRL